MAAGRVRVARDREAADDPVGRLGDEDGRVRVAAERPQVAPLLARAAPGAVGDEPAFGLGGHRLAELDERASRRRRSRGPDRRAVVMPHDDAVAAAPRVAGRGERPVRRAPRRPPRRRRRGCGAASERGRSRARSSRSSSAGSVPALAVDVRRPRRGPAARAIASSTPHAVADDVDDHLHDRAAQAQRAGAADHEPRALVLQHERRRHHARQPRARPPVAPAPVRGRTRRACCSGGCRCRARPRPSPTPVETVSEAAFPRASTTEMCVVPHGGLPLRRGVAGRRAIRSQRGARARPRSRGGPRARRGRGRARSGRPRARACSRITSASAAIASAAPAAASEPSRVEQPRARSRSARRPRTAAGSRGSRGRGTRRRTADAGRRGRRRGPRA